MKKQIRLIELFAGIGSQAMALRDIGADFVNYRVIEFDKYAIQSYNAIHGTNFQTMDITQVHAGDLAIEDTENFNYIMTYSFPCQDLSVAGKQAGMQKDSGTRSGLLWEVERLLTECNTNGGHAGLPQVLLMENVTQVHGKKNKADFSKWLSFLESLGYKNYYQDLNSKDYGIPQNRNRCFMVSKLDNEPFIFPQPQPLKKAMRDFLENEVSDKYYLSDKMFKYALNIENAAPGVGFSDNVNNSYINPVVAHTIGCASAIGQRSGTTNYVDDKKEPIQVGELKRCLQVGSVNIGNNESNNRVYSPAACCPTLNTMQGGHRQPKILETKKEMVNYKIRKLTPRECWRLMGFTDNDFYKAATVCSNTQLYKQAGNSIVKNVLMAIFSRLLCQ